MVYALCGALGAILALFFITGVGLLRYRFIRRRDAQQASEIPPSEPEDEEERRIGIEERARLLAEQRALSRVMNYSVEQAYGLSFTDDEDGEF